MSDDLIERLRDAEPCGVDRCKEMSVRAGCVCAEAANENERLRAALEDLVMACELPGDHCEVDQALPRARAALAEQEKKG